MHECPLCLLRLYLTAVKCCLICMVLLVCRVHGGAATSFLFLFFPTATVELVMEMWIFVV